MPRSPEPPPDPPLYEDLADPEGEPVPERLSAAEIDNRWLTYDLRTTALHDAFYTGEITLAQMDAAKMRLLDELNL